jgi:hypothetical protein
LSRKEAQEAQARTSKAEHVFEAVVRNNSKGKTLLKQWYGTTARAEHVFEAVVRNNSKGTRIKKVEGLFVSLVPFCGA